MSGAFDPFKEWDENPSNPYSSTLASGSATVSSGYVSQQYPDTWQNFIDWAKKKKTSEPIGLKDERIVILYSGETERLMDNIAKYVSIELGFHVLTAPNIYEKGSGNKIAFGPCPNESLNDFIRRMINSSRAAIILYTEQGGQIIETSWCSDYLKSSLGLVYFYRGKNKPEDEEKTCPFLKEVSSGLFICSCTRQDRYENRRGAYVCLSPRVFCHFTQQKITKMVLDIYIMNSSMRLFGSEKTDILLEPIAGFLKTV